MKRTAKHLFGILALIAVHGISVGGAPARAAEEAFTLSGPLELANADGNTVSTGDFAGQWLLVYFGYTHCADLCPTGLSIMTQALAEIGPAANYVQPLFVTIDPERDHGEILRTFPAAFDARMIGLGGTPAQINAATVAMRVDFEREEGAGDDYDISHSDNFTLVEPGGRKATTIIAADPYVIAGIMVAHLKAGGVDLSNVNNLGAFQ